jgi:hypothetical protein
MDSEGIVSLFFTIFFYLVWFFVGHAMFFIIIGHALFTKGIHLIEFNPKPYHFLMVKMKTARL